jgi:hypothetical protein
MTATFLSRCERPKSPPTPLVRGQVTGGVLEAKHDRRHPNPWRLTRIVPNAGVVVHIEGGQSHDAGARPCHRCFGLSSILSHVRRRAARPVAATLVSHDADRVIPRSFFVSMVRTGDVRRGFRAAGDQA